MRRCAARNLGQTAVYFLQTGAMEEAATLYQQARTWPVACAVRNLTLTLLLPSQAKNIFDSMLDPDTRRRGSGSGTCSSSSTPPPSSTSAAAGGAEEGRRRRRVEHLGDKLALPAAEPDAAANPQEWWLRNMANGAAASAEGGGPDFWQRNLGSADGDGDALAFMQQMFADTAHFTPNDGGGGANGGPNLGYANDWVAGVFEAPAGDAGGVVDEKMGDALDWLSRRSPRARGRRAAAAAAATAARWTRRRAGNSTGCRIRSPRAAPPRQPLALAQPQRDAGHRRAGQPVGVHAAAERAGRAGVGDALGRRRARRGDERGALDAARHAEAVGGADAVLGHGMSKMFKRQVL